ncbi:hypothetical protein K2Z83_01075 [Oscillochloris sp. ZM17-4]|uniref:hypothetical protein n=1 Tax=Oscillochloris sp. ZM17-4 TaxID=2866714 RepID=UPI001C72FEF5|nr:hypothetical protein [Oscillochloris sp. ZM17-4]MBX0326286.1 hypothetical protein [Oscillochloris sp. ZM17-4]
MAIEDQVTPAQWLALRQGPWAAGCYVATAVGGKVQQVRELLALGEALRQEIERGGEGDLVAEVAAAVLGEAPMDAAPGPSPDDRPALLRAVAAAGAAAGGLAGGEVYRRWLVGLARAVAEAESDGGFLGFGAEAMHAAEQAALAEVAEALGLLGISWGLRSDRFYLPHTNNITGTACNTLAPS